VSGIVNFIITLWFKEEMADLAAGHSKERRLEVDHRYYHHSLVNQSLHLFSASSFVLTYFLLFWDPAIAGLIGWIISMLRFAKCEQGAEA
jgi:hypothetical protein